MGNLFSRFVFFKILSWKIMGHFPKFSKYIVAVVPHTSWLDFFIGLMVRSISKEQEKKNCLPLLQLGFLKD